MMKKTLIILAVGLAVVLAGGHGVLAQIVVTTTDDELNAEGDCSLREAVEAANTGAYEFEPLIGADVTITKSDTPDPVRVGEDLTYTIVVTNNGPDLTIDNVFVSDTLPTGVDFVSVDTTQGTYNFTLPDLIQCDLGILDANQTATITIVVRPTNDVAGGIIWNCAQASMPEGGNDPDFSNNRSCTVTEVQRLADLSVTKTDNPDPVIAGDDLTYTLTVTNAGPNDATNVVLTDTLPSGVTFVSASPGCSFFAPQTVICSLGTLPANGSGDVTIVVRPTEPGIITNTAEVTSAEDDPNPTNNQDDEPTQILSGQGIIRGFKWLDIDGDGHKASYEPFLRGITIILTGTDVWGNPIALTAVTDEQGQFVFVNLPPGTYLVCEVRPDVISYQTFPRTGPICPNSEFPGWDIALNAGEVREIAFGNVFDELYFEPMALNSIVQAVPQRDGILFRPQYAFLVRELQVEIYDLNGRVIYRSLWEPDEVLWKLQNERGQRVARGVYLYVVTMRAVDGTRGRCRSSS